MEEALEHTLVRRFRGWMQQARASACPLIPDGRGSRTRPQSEVFSILHRPLIPMHLPVMPASLTRPAGGSLSGRRCSRLRSRVTAWRWTESLIAFCPFHATGSPKSRDKYDLGPYGHSGEQLLVIDRLFGEVMSFIRLRPAALSLLAAAPGRGPAKVVGLLSSFEDAFTFGRNSGWEKLMTTYYRCEGNQCLGHLENDARELGYGSA